MARRVEWKQDNVVSQEPNVAVKSEIGDWKKKSEFGKLLLNFERVLLELLRTKIKENARKSKAYMKIFLRLLFEKIEEH